MANSTAGNGNKNKSDVLCDKCGSEFNIANSGRSGIKDHISSKKHSGKLLVVSSSRTMKNFVSASV